MLAYILAVFVGTGSVGLYLSAFFLPEIHRKQDFIWSGVGCFYALFLWLYAHQVTGGILVGQTSSVALIGWLAWQTVKLRRQLVPIGQQTPIPSTTKLQKQIGLNRSTPTAKAPAASKPVTPSVPSPTPIPTVQPQSMLQGKGLVNEQPAPGDSIPLSQVKIPPASPKETAPVARNLAPEASKTSPPANPKLTETETTPVVSNIAPAPSKTVPPVPSNLVTEDDRAWIKLEAKPAPAPAPAQPLGTPAQPPPLLSPAASIPEIAQPAKIPQAETDTADPSEPLPTIAKLDSEDWL